MTSILSALMPYTTNGGNKNQSGYSSDASFDDLMQIKAAAEDIKAKTSSAYSPVSTSALGASDWLQAYASTQNKDANGTDALMDFVQQVLSRIDDSLQNIVSPTTQAKSYDSSYSSITGISDLTSDEGFEQMLAGGGPLPAFLKEMDVRLNLNATQRQALRDIAQQNMNIVKSPESVQKLAEQLRAAGIG